MFEIETRKHSSEVAFSAHVGYQIDYATLLLSFSFYKYNLTIEWIK